MEVSIALLVMFVLFFIGAPVFISILSSSLVYFTLSPDLNSMIVVQRLVGGIQSIPLLAIPFFVMAGVCMNYTGITRRMLKFSEILTGHLPGGLAQVNVVLSTAMGGLSGSSIADAAMQSKMLVPEMTRRGYSKSFATAVTGASALITPIIPPGVSLILFGYIANVSIGKLFLAGIVPGLMTCIFMMIAVHVISKKRGYLPLREKPARIGEILIASKDAALAILMVVVIIGGIRLGIFTPTEAGSIAVLYSLVIGFFVYREMKLKDLKIALSETVTTTASIMLIMGAAGSVSWFLTWERIPQMATSYMINMVDSPLLFLLSINIFLLIIGMFFEGNAAMIVLIPILMPMVEAYGIDPVHFGMVFIFNMAVGSLSPPLGTVMFTTCSITGVSIGDFVKEAWPFYIVLVLCLIIITYIPYVSIFLPNLIM